VTPSKCGELAADVARTISRFQGWNIAVSGTSRLSKTRAVLEKVAANGSYPIDQLAIVGNAIRTALDFREIAKLVGPTREEALAHDINSALKGTVDQQQPSHKPYQFQTQLWMGAILQAAGLTPTVPTDRDTPNPDFTIDLAPGLYAAEVKRPGSLEQAEKRLSKAKDQLNACGLAGLVVLDVSDCFDDAEKMQVVASPAGPPQDRISKRFRQIKKALSSKVSDPATRLHRPGYSSVIVLALLARGFRWDLDNLAVPDPFVTVAMGLFTSVKYNLQWHHGQSIRNRLEQGLNASGIYAWRTWTEHGD